MVYSYTIGVLITGVFVQDLFADVGRFLLLGIVAVISLAWVAYFYQFMQPKMNE